MPATAAAPSMSPAQLNLRNRALVLQQSVNQITPLPSQTVFPANQPQLTITPNFVGLIKRFYVEVTGTITNTGSQTLTLTDWGLANIISNIIYTDPTNNQRINTLGLHLALLSCAKRNRPFGTALPINTLFTVGGVNNIASMLNSPAASWPVFSAPNTITTGAGSGTFRAVYELPLSYTDQDLRGAVYSNLVNATQNIQITLNANAVVANPAEDAYAVYSGPAGAAGAITTATVTVYQEYLYQLPMGQGGVPILPGIDISTIYQLKNSPFMGIAANQRYPVSYSNFNSFISTTALFNSTGAKGGRLYGTDVNYWQLLAANLTAIWQYDPLLAAQFARERLLFDLPAGAYYFDSRQAPILTNQFGNIQLALTPLAGGANATLNVLWEYFASQNTAGSGGSLAVA